MRRRRKRKEDKTQKGRGRREARVPFFRFIISYYLNISRGASTG